MLLGRVEQLSREVSSLRKALEAQMDMGENLGAATAAMDCRISAIEKCCGPSGLDPGTGVSREGEVLGPGSVRPGGDTGSSSGKHTAANTTTQSSAVKAGHLLKPVPKNAAVRPKPVAVQAHLKQGQKKMGIIVTGTESNIKVLKTKLVSVFDTRFSPNLDADTK